MNNNYLEEERYIKAQKKVKEIKGFYWHLFWYLAVNIFILAMIYKNLDANESLFEYGHFTTPFFWGIGLFFHWIGVFGRNIVFSKDWEDRKVKEFMDKDKFE
ncbi:MAG: 2TM domain-containing protein [Flavobacteriaceae bacterium]|nr:2TM domain-containing protein [Flavobacteriaceae bacterium]